MQIIDYNKLTTFLVNVLDTSNTMSSSFDLSDGLEKRVVSICDENLSIHPTFKSRYPMVSVGLVNKTEDIMQIGGAIPARKVSIFWDIECVYDSMLNAETNLWALVGNIETNLRYNSSIYRYEDLGFKITSILPSVEFKRSYGEDSAFNKSAVIHAEMQGVVKNV